MIHDIADDPGAATPQELRAVYETELRGILDTQGIEDVAARSGLDQSTLQALQDGDSPDLTLEEAASILALRPDEPDADTIATTARDALLMGMTTAVLDVEAVESGLNGELEAREIQSKVEGRFPMTLAEFALLQQFIEARK